MKNVSDFQLHVLEPWRWHYDAFGYARESPIESVARRLTVLCQYIELRRSETTLYSIDIIQLVPSSIIALTEKRLPPADWQQHPDSTRAVQQCDPARAARFLDKGKLPYLILVFFPRGTWLSELTIPCWNPVKISLHRASPASGLDSLCLFEL